MEINLFKIFLGITIIFAIVIGVVSGIISRIAIPLIANSEQKLSLLIQILFNILILFTDSLGYFFMYRAVLSKCDFSYKLRDTIKNEWEVKKNIREKINENKLNFFFIIFSILICHVIWFITIFFLRKKIGGFSNTNPFLDFSALFIPIFEEFIFRKIYFDYCKLYNIKHTYALNIIIFSFAHIVPLPYHFILAAVLAYCYKKFDSLLLNIIIHFLFNLIGIFIPSILSAIV